MDNWDFDCPQFVDFAAALDSPSNEVFYDASYDVLTAASGSDLGPKMATPKVKPSDQIHPFTNYCTDDEKIATLSKLHGRLSKSDGCVNQIIESLKSPEEKDNHKEGRRKRRTSFPISIKKRRVLALTPNCLKRTVKKNAKTSEELELLKIAEMQDKLHKHLRLNKINLQRMKMNKAPFPLAKLPKKSESKAPGIKNNVLAFQSSKPTTAFNRNLLCQNDAACGTTSPPKRFPERLQNQEKKPNIISKKKAPSNALRDLNAQKRDTVKTSKEMPLFVRYNGHGGLKFLPHQEKTAPQPFSFDSSNVSQNASLRSANRSKLQNPLSISKNATLYNLENKENLK